ncbi:MAG: nucleotide sugar dehydrogenase [Spirochaetaceae bacterium]|nr:nucleotide sugar dehydrogenase [Spirochaetaceae bacterium]MCF7947172.1 nucleotide sugar dehydrogenase [Spirochaetia bacterium]MCF7950037.1 nucleotide sugar dehydrogenase [Spirochaetaceae bacterium]
MDRYKSGAEELLERIEGNDIIIGILGLGYVGLPLAVTFARAGVQVIGFEKNAEKAQMVNRGQNYIADVDDSELSECVEIGRLGATTDFSRLAEVDAAIVCVPSPLDKFRKPDISFIEAAGRDIARYIRRGPGVFISLESTTYPTTTEETMLPILEEQGLVLDRDFWLCFSPERVDPGNKSWKTKNTPKVVGALGAEAQRIAMAIYGRAVENLHAVSSPRVAEMVKILENTYRLVNISLVNELALLAGKMGIDFWEVIEAAKTKPYGFQPFYPGPGVGGHCIPLDPFYLEHIARNYDFDLTMIETAGRINTIMPHRMVVKIIFSLNKQEKSIKGSRILFLGVAYKADIGDERESPALEIINEVYRKGGLVDYHDPYLPTIATAEGIELESVELNEEVLAGYDCVVITTNHRSFDGRWIAEHAKLVVDLRNVVPAGINDHVYRL